MTASERSAGAVVAVAGVGVRYPGGVQALSEVDLEFGPGITALVGVNGAGKSTLMSLVGGAMPPTVGSVAVDGTDLYGRGRRGALRRVALMPQFLVAPRNLTAAEAVEVLGWLRGLPGRELRVRSAAALAAVDLTAHADRKVKELSGGMQRRVALAQAIVAEPEVLLLDEPSTGLDPQQRRGMVDLVRNLTGTVIFSSHVMEDVTEVADRVVVLHEGRVRFDGTIAALEEAAPPTAIGRRAEGAFLALITGAAGAANR